MTDFNVADFKPVMTAQAAATAAAARKVWRKVASVRAR